MLSFDTTNINDFPLFHIGPQISLDIFYQSNVSPLVNTSNIGHSIKKNFETCVGVQLVSCEAV